MILEKLDRFLRSFEGSMTANQLTLCITGVIFVSFLLFYTMYDKKTKSLIPSKLFSILTFQEGFSKFLSAMNKILALNGLTVLAVSFYPRYRHIRAKLLLSAIIQLLVHTAYSAYSFYGTKKVPIISSFFSLRAGDGIKKLSVVFGIVANCVLLSGYMSYIPYSKLAFFGLAFSVLHFYTMEMDHKYILRVRPYGFIVFPASLAGVLYGARWLA